MAAAVSPVFLKTRVCVLTSLSTPFIQTEPNGNESIPYSSRIAGTGSCNRVLYAVIRPHCS